MKSAVAAFVFSACALTSGCATSGGTRAVIADPSAQGHAELIAVIAQRLHRTDVLIADDALMRDSTLIIEPVRPRDTQGQLLNGRETRLPEHFTLLKRGSHCYLQHERTGEQIELHYVHCSSGSTR